MSYLSALYSAEFHVLTKTPFEELSAERQVLRSIHALEIEVFNGGFEQYVTNLDGGQLDAAIGALRRIGAERWAGIAERARRIAFVEAVPHDRRLRQERIRNLSASELAELDRLGTGFRERYMEVFPLLEGFARSHAASFSVIPVSQEELPERARQRSVTVRIAMPPPIAASPVEVWPAAELDGILDESSRQGLACVGAAFVVVLPDRHDWLMSRPEAPAEHFTGEPWSDFVDRCAHRIAQQCRRALAELDAERPLGLDEGLIDLRSKGVDLKTRLHVSASFVRNARVEPSSKKGE